MAHKNKNTRPKSRLKPEQYEALRPYFPVMKQFRDHGAVAAQEFGVVDKIAQQIGEPKTDLWCSGCCKALLKTMIAEVENYDPTTFDPQM